MVNITEYYLANREQYLHMLDSNQTIHPNQTTQTYDPQQLNDDNMPVILDHSTTAMCMALVEPYRFGIHGDNRNAVGHYIIVWIPTREECMDMMLNQDTMVNGLSLELVRPYELPSGELMGLRMTGYLRRIQRRWRRRFMVRYMPFYEARRIRTLDTRQRFGNRHQMVCANRTNIH